MKRRSLVVSFIAFFLQVCLLKAQEAQTDSVFTVRKDTTSSKEKRLNALYLAGKSLLHSQPDSAYYLFKQGLRFAKHHNYTGEEIAKILLGVSVSYRYQARYDSALKYCQLALNDCKDRKDWKNGAYVFNCLGAIHNDLRNFAQSKFYSDSAQYYYDLYRPGEFFLGTMMNLSAIYQQIGELDQAEQILKKAIKYTGDNTLERGMVYTNLTSTLMAQSKYQLAVQYGELAITICRFVKNKLSLVKVSDYMAAVHYHLKNYDETLKYARLTYALGDELNIAKYKSLGLMNKAIVYGEWNQLDSMLFFSRNALKHTSETDFHSHQCIYNNMHITYKKLGQTDSSLYFLTLHLIAKDSLKHQEKRENAIKAMARQEIKKKAETIAAISGENQHLKHDMNLQKYHKYIVIVTLIIFVFLAGVIHGWYRKVQRVKKAAMEKNMQTLETRMTEMAFSLKHKKEVFAYLRNNFEKLKRAGKMDSSDWLEVKKKLEQETELDQDLALFEDELQYANASLYAQLTSINKTLSRRELRLAALIKMGLSSKDIAEVFSMTPGSVDALRYNLRKKLEIGHSGQSLSTFLKNIN